MLTDVAGSYTTYSVDDFAEFLQASQWNLRDLRQSVGNGTDVTMFASINSGWSFLDRDDIVRLGSDRWAPHLLDLLRHNIVQGAYTAQNLKNLFVKEAGPFELTSLAGQPFTIGYNANSNRLTIADGEVFVEDIQGVDG